MSVGGWVWVCVRVCVVGCVGGECEYGCVWSGCGCEYGCVQGSEVSMGAWCGECVCGHGCGHVYGCEYGCVVGG